MSSADAAPILVLAPRHNTKLIERRDTPSTLTSNRETDVRSALTRGIAEYVDSLSLDFPGTRARFQTVRETWSEPEEMATYPGAVVYALGEGQYDASRFTPKLIATEDGVTLRATAEFTLDLIVEVWTNSQKSRMAHCAMLEDAFDPVEWMTGFILEVPHYHNARAVFEKLTLTYEDDASNAQVRWRKAIFTLMGQVVQYRVIKRPPQVKIDLRVEAEDGLDC